jgi:hypothetical protein
MVIHTVYSKRCPFDRRRSPHVCYWRFKLQKYSFAMVGGTTRAWILETALGSIDMIGRLALPY